MWTSGRRWLNWGIYLAISRVLNARQKELELALRVLGGHCDSWLFGDAGSRFSFFDEESRQFHDVLRFRGNGDEDVGGKPRRQLTETRKMEEKGFAGFCEVFCVRDGSPSSPPLGRAQIDLVPKVR